ncbi:MAG: hypothetical protein BWK73_04815 [Thiothrix lacustris]|uniref:Uncharacterized protein n=1 Tax=Thiothrix lacustris TaxID=525917 RepID=A0A1Y1QXK2_9GAMM|nr:MAG: hypothetical protein BWK73_04815 [Thiothrix lacustris]
MSSLEINVDTRNFTRLQATLAAFGDDDLDKLLRKAVNNTASWAKRKIDDSIAKQIGISPEQLNSRFKAQKSDFDRHFVRSSWLWYGGFDIFGTRLIQELGMPANFTPGQVQVGKFIWRRGFISGGDVGQWGADTGNLEGKLMQRVNDSASGYLPDRAREKWRNDFERGRLPIKRTRVEFGDMVIESINSISPAIPGKLETELEKAIAIFIENG